MKKITSIILILALCMMSIPVFAEDSFEEMEETVYGILDSSGSVEKVIVTEHVQKSQDTLTIQTDLEEVEILMDDVDVTNTEHAITFNTSQSDLYFKGTSQKALPIETSITYTLDGKTIQPEDLAGQSGHLVMTIGQVNKETRTITVNGASQEVYLPFETALVMNMSNNHFENVTTTSGKLIDDGSVKVLTAVLVPGMAETLDLESDLLVDEITLEADVTDMTLGAIYMTTVCKLPEIDVSMYTEEINGLDSKVNDFKTAGTQLSDGIDDLQYGVMQYFTKQHQAFEGYNAFMAGNEQILKGIMQFSGSFTEFNSALNLYTSGVLDLIDNLELISSKVPALLQGLSAFQQGFEQAVPVAAAPELHGGLTQLQGGLTALNDGLTALNSGAQTLKTKTNALTVASTQLNAAIEQLAGGAKQLDNKSEQLSTGIHQLDTASAQIQAGTTQYQAGVHTFKRDGIDALVTEVEGVLARVQEFENKYDVLKDLVAKYDHFATDNEMDSRVIFIFKTDAIQ